MNSLMKRPHFKIFFNMTKTFVQIIALNDCSLILNMWSNLNKFISAKRCRLEIPQFTLLEEILQAHLTPDVKNKNNKKYPLNLQLGVHIMPFTKKSTYALILILKIFES